jgi:hypothetical protein
MDDSGIVCFAAACTVRAFESTCAGTLDGPDESGTRGEKASKIALSMELPTSRIEFFVSIAASAGNASTFFVASAFSILFFTTYMYHGRPRQRSNFGFGNLECISFRDRTEE